MKCHPLCCSKGDFDWSTRRCHMHQKKEVFILVIHHPCILTVCCGRDRLWTIGAVWQPKSSQLQLTLLSFYTNQRSNQKSPACVFVCHACHSSFHPFFFLLILLFVHLLFISVVAYLAAIQVKVGCIRKCTWLCWEVRVSAPTPPSFNYFFI